MINYLWRVSRETLKIVRDPQTSQLQRRRMRGVPGHGDGSKARVSARRSGRTDPEAESTSCCGELETNVWARRSLWGRVKRCPGGLSQPWRGKVTGPGVAAGDGVNSHSPWVAPGPYRLGDLQAADS